MTRRRSLRRLAVIAAVALIGGIARGDRATPPQTIEHKVKAGDTLALLAAEYYGDRNHQIFIMVANRLDHPRALVAGERLVIPASREITADVGDTFASLAATYLGDARRGEFLATFNGLGAGDTPAAGAIL
jgi:predicted Zn-dependent protease